MTYAVVIYESSHARYTVGAIWTSVRYLGSALAVMATLPSGVRATIVRCDAMAAGV